MKRSTLRHAALRVVAASSLAACSAASDIHYEYEKIGVSTDRGFFNVTLNPEPARKEVDGEMRIVWSSPYLFNTQYITLEDAMLLKGEIRNLVLTNAETGQVVVEEDYVLDTRRKAERPDLVVPRKLIGFGVDPRDLPYVDYQIEFQFQITGSDGETYDEGSVSTKVRRTFFSGSRPEEN